MEKQKSHLAILDVLRAVAAISVCLFHFNRNDDPTLTLGRYGVEVFFIISGFIIPLAMYWSSFRYRDSFNFLVRRGIRLYPLFAIIALTELVMNTVGSSLFGYSGGKTDLTWARAFFNFTLSCDLVGAEWYRTVFWTLAIEAQYYLCIILTFPLLISKKTWVQILSLLLWIIPSFIAGYGGTVFTWTAFFTIGILAFLLKQKLIKPTVYLVMTALAMYAHIHTRNETSAWIGLATALIIIYSPAIKCRPLVWLGSISYSLYITHLMIGGAVIHHMRQLPEAFNDPYIVVLVAAIGSIGGASLVFHFIEVPLHNMARRFKTRSREKQIAAEQQK